METSLKIALVGSAPASVRAAPYQDPGWKVWGCSPGVYGVGTRFDAWFELHRYEPGQSWFSPEYCQFMARFKGPVFMSEKRAEIPNSESLPVVELVQRYSPYFFTSTLAWMFACAIEAGARTIGLWGVDMAATEEYGYQRAGCQYFAMIAASLGIEVGTPPEADLFAPPPLYGISELEHGQIKLLARKRELEARLGQAERDMDFKKGEVYFLKGALDDLDYLTKTWARKDPWVSPFVPEILPKLSTILVPADLSKEPPSTRGRQPRKRKSNGQAEGPPV